MRVVIWLTEGLHSHESLKNLHFTSLGITREDDSWRADSSQGLGVHQFCVVNVVCFCFVFAFISYRYFWGIQCDNSSFKVQSIWCQLGGLDFICGAFVGSHDDVSGFLGEEDLFSIRSEHAWLWMNSVTDRQGYCVRIINFPYKS